ncbi:unnamed protein product [Closterium sp. Naga37s-1]|nr:unnamed protein product [Closterium sp. Naga37s-1]
MAAPSLSTTVALRSKGNAFYASAFTHGIDPLLKRSRLNIALSKYREALRRHVAESQPSADELSSLCKNVATVSSALAACHADAYKAYKPPVMDAASSERVMQHGGQGGGHLHICSRCLCAGQWRAVAVGGDGCVGEMRARDSWKQHFGDKDPNTVDWTATSTRHIEAFAAFHVAFSQFLLEKGQSLLTINLARCSHSPQPTTAAGITAGVNGISLGAGGKGPARLVVQRESARCFAECERPLRLLDDALLTLERNLAGRSCGNQSVTQATLSALRNQVKELQTARFTSSCLCESVETLVRTMALYAQAAAKAEDGGSTDGGSPGGSDADVALLWAAVDGFKEAVVLTRERHVDMEAYALSWLGHVYDVALRMDDIGHRYHQRAVQLVLSATQSHPKLALSTWYSASVRAIDRHQAKVRRQEEQQREKEREPLLAKMKPELETLSKMSESGWKQLLTHVYSKYPPKNGNGNLKCPSLNADDAKVSLRMAILHYHPDKNSEHGDRWKILCEEVTKCLNAKYLNFK